MNNKESIEVTINSLVSQIEILSKRCILENNKKNNDFNKTLEASSLMLQLSRTLSELIMIQKSMEYGDINSNVFEFLLNGRNR